MFEKKAITSPEVDPAVEQAINDTLRNIAGWPQREVYEGSRRNRIRERLVHYDANGNITGATDRLYEEDLQVESQINGQ